MCAPPPPLLHRPSTPAFTAFTAFTTFTSYAASLPSHLLHRRLFHRLQRLLHCRRLPAFLVQDDYIGLFDEVKFPDASKQSNPLATVVSNLAEGTVSFHCVTRRGQEPVVRSRQPAAGK